MSTKFETSYERALAEVKRRRKAQAEQQSSLRPGVPRGQRITARFARPSLPHKYPRVHYELPEMKEVYGLVKKHGLFLLAESLARVGFHNAQIAKRGGDRDYGEDLHSVAKKLMTTIANHHEAANQIVGTTSQSPSDARMSEIADAIGFHMVVQALAVGVQMMATQTAIGRGDSRQMFALSKDLERVANETKFLYRS